MGSDERNEDSPAPLPPHERTWRHPSEMGSWEHDASMRASSPPPLSRRTTTIVALLSAACSIAVIAIAIPRGVNSKSGDAAQSPTTQPSKVLVAARQQISHALVRVGASGAPGLSLTINGDSVVVSSADAVSQPTDSLVSIRSDDGIVGSAVVVTRDAESGLVILRAQDPDNTLPRIAVAAATTSVTDGELFMVFDQETFAMEVVRRGIALTTSNRLVPLDMSDEISGVTAVSNRDGSIVGVAIDRNHTRWLIPLGVICDLIARAVGE